MARNNQQSTNKTRRKPVEEGSKRLTDADKAEVNKPKPKVKAQISSKKQPPIPEIKEIDIQNSLPETEMEVYHHPQLDHKPKPFKEYLLEGFMIFIAVMMGFIAENIRESITDSEHVRQLTVQLVHDLKSDTAQLNQIYNAESKINKGNDTLFNILQQPLAKADLKKIQQIAVNSHSMWLFHPSAGAINAIKNELHLKKFSNSELITYFSRYEKHVELLRTAQDINLEYQKNYLDPFLTQHFTPANLNAAFAQVTLPDAQMRNLTQADLTQLRTNMVLIKVMSKELVDSDTLLKKDAVSMLKYVTKQFDIEDK